MIISKKGLVSKTRLLKQDPNLLARFSLISDDKTYNCIVSNDLIIHKILMMPENCVTVKVNGYFNKRNQFVVKELCYQSVVRIDDYYRKHA